MDGQWNISLLEYSPDVSAVDVSTLPQEIADIWVIISVLLETSGALDTFAHLPAANAHQFEFSIVDDTNTLYNSDGINRRDLGGPIQGPQGDSGEDGSDGSNGVNGRGWYDTNVIDQRTEK